MCIDFVFRSFAVPESHKLFPSIGLAICSWQMVEAQHYRLFLKMLGAPNPDV